MSSPTFANVESGPCAFCGKQSPPFVSTATKLVICKGCVHLCGERFTEAVSGSAELEREMEGASEKERALVAERLAVRAKAANDTACSFCNSVPPLQIQILAGPQHYICKACVGEAARAVTQ